MGSSPVKSTMMFSNAKCKYCDTEYIHLMEDSEDSVCPVCRLRQKDKEDMQKHFTNPRPLNSRN